MHPSLKRLELRLRRRAPHLLRSGYRVARSIYENPVTSAELPQEMVKDCRVFASRFDLIDALPQGGVVAEVGTATGAFAAQILARCQPRELHVIDIDYAKFDRNIATDERVRRHEGLSQAVMAQFPDHHFDWIYIDADHAFEAVLGDARTSAPKLKEGGLMIFNDFAHIDPFLGRYGVHRAVTAFALEMRWPLHLLAMNPVALYDVALRKLGKHDGS
jgi:predicted O-methyltransferase YrrM